MSDEPPPNSASDRRLQNVDAHPVLRWRLTASEAADRVRGDELVERCTKKESPLTPPEEVAAGDFRTIDVDRSFLAGEE
jgi:hypothetical protein